MRWKVQKWDDKDDGAFRTVFEGTEKKAKAYYKRSVEKMPSAKTCGFLLVRMEPTCGIIISSRSSKHRKQWIDEDVE